MTRRWIPLVLMLVAAGCGPRRPPVTWLETVTEPPDPRRGARAFWFNRYWYVGDCSLTPGSHVTLTRDVAMVGLHLSAVRQGAQFRFGITMLAADGTTLAHYPFADNGRMYVVNDIPVGSGRTRGTDVPITRDIYDRVDRVLIHASC